MEVYSVVAASLHSVLFIAQLRHCLIYRYYYVVVKFVHEIVPLSYYVPIVTYEP